MTTKNNIALTVLLPIIIVGGSIGLYFALKPKKCPDGITNIPRNPITGKRDISACPSAETNGGTPPPSGAGGYGGAETIDSGKDCRFPLKNQSGAAGDEGSQKCVQKVKQALAPEINEMGWFEEDVYGEKVQKALDDFLEDEVSSNEQPLAKLKQAFGGCGNWLQGYDNCKLFNDQYRHLLEKRNIPVAWNQELNQWV